MILDKGIEIILGLFLIVVFGRVLYGTYTGEMSDDTGLIRISSVLMVIFGFSIVWIKGSEIKNMLLAK